MKVSSIYLERIDGNGYDYYASFSSEEACHQLMTRLYPPPELLKRYKSYCVKSEEFLRPNDVEHKCPKCPFTLSTIPSPECEY